MIFFFKPIFFLIIVRFFSKCFLFPFPQIKSNAVRALGNLSRFVKCTSLSGSFYKPMDHVGLSRKNNSDEVFTSSNDMKGSHGNASSSFHPASIEDSSWLERMVQAFISCVTTGNVKVSYPHCYICGTTFVVEHD
jgi:hypothetical protein